jgi:gliding motility-associated-like protein
MTLTVLDVSNSNLSASICAGEVYDFNGLLLYVAGTYADTVLGSNGCDSIITLELEIHPAERTELIVEICEGEELEYQGLKLTESMVRNDTFTSNSGCDSIVTLILTVNRPYFERIQATICEGEYFDFNGNLFNLSGVYRDTFVSKFGCDSIRMLDLFVLPILRENISAEICEGDSFFFGGKELTETGSYVDSLTSATGCDSVVYLDLIVYENRFSSETIEICGGESVMFQGKEISESGVYTDTLKSVTGCDSIITLDLMVYQVYNTKLEFSICAGDSVEVAGKVYNRSGVFIDTLKSILGCDSVLTISLDVLEIKYTEIVNSICSDITYNFNGISLDESGVYVDTLVSSVGCDSIVTLTLQVLPVKMYTFEKQVCINQSFTFGGTRLTSSGIYVDTISAVNGCDSIITVDFRVVDVIEVEIRDTICENEVAVYNGISYDKAGRYSDTLLADGGCDSIMHINIYVAPIERTSLSISICEGDTYDFYGTPIISAGVYYETLVSRFGCDSILELNLSVTPTVHTDLSASICEGEVFAVGDTAFDMSGNYDVVLSSGVGCDSIVHLDLEVIPTSRYIDSVNICQGETYTFNGIAYDTSGTYIDTLVSASGCDSLAILQLHVHPLPFTTIMYNLCSSEEVEIDGRVYRNDTTFELIYSGVYGCDSSVTYEITFLPDITISARSAEICEGETVQLQVEVTGADSAQVTWTPAEGLSCTDCLDPIANPQRTTTYLVSTVGCGGEVIEVEVTVEVVPLPGLTVTPNQTIDLGQTITLQGVNEVPTIPINWYDEESGELLCADCPRYETKPTKAGTYYFRASSINSLGCGEDSIVVVTVADPCEVEKIVAANAFTPNNDGFNDFFEIRNGGISNIGLVQVFNRWGEIVFETQSFEDKWDGTFRGEPVNPGVYVYIIYADCVNGSTFQLAGNVTIIR